MTRTVGRGSFVQTLKPYQIAKVERPRNGCVQVALFHSIGTPEVLTAVRADELRAATLSEHTRVYFHQESARRWWLGRIDGNPQFINGQVRYPVRLPGVSGATWIPEKSLFVRCIGADTDPVEVLLHADGLESQFSYDRRIAAVRALVHLRAASHGLTGLLSAAVDLLPHQIDVVRRVLSDPVQRYLLADEVGLGKTIEAGIIIRQTLLDSPQTTVTVLAPAQLIGQWEHELESKFGVGDFPRRLTVRPFEVLADPEAKACGLLVVDEAHHLVTGEGCEGPAYQRLAALAHASERVLLLSATPVIGNEQAMFALLHLLDPVTYPQASYAAFLDRVARRQEYGDVLSVMRSDAAAFRRIRLAGRMRELFREDHLINDLLPVFAEGADENRATATRILKRHIAETYRLHQRLIRTRRRDVIDWQPRSGSVRVRVDADPRMESVTGMLEDWRNRAAFASQTSEALESALRTRYVELFAAAAGGVETLRRALRSQESKLRERHMPTFEDDEDLLESMRSTLDASLERVPTHARAIRDQLTGTRKVVAFTSSRDAAYEAHADLDAVRGLRGGAPFLLVGDMDRRSTERVLEEFQSHRGTAALICDRAGEEGLNLHFAHTLVHLDLPLSPARLEQRVGRLDRYGRAVGEIQHVIIVPSDAEDSPWLAWLDALQNGFCLFSTSLSEVQFLLPQLEPQLEQELFLRGAQGLRSLKPRITQQLADERSRLDQQYALDKLEIDERDELALSDALANADGQESEFAEPLDQWWSHGLHLERHADPTRKGVFLLSWKPTTEVPNVPWRKEFKAGLDRPLTFHRSLAVNFGHVRLVRPGLPLLDRQQDYLNWDDRGTAYATWRRMLASLVGNIPTWQGFRLTYVIETDRVSLGKLLAALSDDRQLDPLSRGEVDSLIPAVMRRADALMPPRVAMLYVGAGDLRVVRDATLLKLLDLPYCHFSIGEANRDYNIAKRASALAAVIDHEEFADICRDVRSIAEDVVRDDEEFQHATKAAALQARSIVEEENKRLQRRRTAIVAETGVDDAGLRREITINEVLAELVDQPRVRLDSIGFIVLSNNEPPSAVLASQ